MNFRTEPEHEVITCPICGSENEILYLSNLDDRQWEENKFSKVFSYFQCLSCKIIFLYPTPSQDIVYRFYPPASEYYAYQAHNIPHLYKVLKYIGKKKNILSTTLKWIFFLISI